MSFFPSEMEEQAPSVELPPFDPAEALEALGPRVADVFGIEELRPMQREAIEANLGGQDLLLVLPTGGGKSLCYQAPALVRPGLTLVISPLISLMKDQVDGLVQNGVAAAMLASNLEADERRQVMDDLRAGRLDLLYVSPERLFSPGFIELVSRGCSQPLAAIAIDEAHCISQWGHDFRPEYRRLGGLREALPDVPLHAYTATATSDVRDDIVRALGFSDPAVLVAPFDRPNLIYRSLPRTSVLDQIREVIARHPGDGGIVYCISRKETERIAGGLSKAGVRAEAYHAGLPSQERARVQERFQSEEVDVVVATVAFGMGIDRTNVRFVVHASLPKGVEQYAQETGRAGRDGLEAECTMFYSGSDYYSWKGLVERSAAETADALEDSWGGWGGEPEQDAQEARDEAAFQAAKVQEAAIERLGKMMGFASGGICRHRALVEYFGQELAEPGQDYDCGACDVCLGELEELEDGKVISQKILSCIVRTGQRFGSGHVADVLKGAKTQNIKKYGHDALSTYGLLPEFDKDTLRSLIDQLVGLGFIMVAPGQYPTLYLSPEGGELMYGNREVRLVRVPQAKASASRSGSGRRRKSAAAEELAEGASEIFERLRALRRELARSRGVPPYVIFTDRTLVAMANHNPRTLEDFGRLPGVGAKKLEDLGPIFVAELSKL